MPNSYLHLLKNIKAFIFDVDGVMTDGKVLLDNNNNQLRSVNIRDGFALQFAVKKGYKIAIISGGKSEAVRTRFTNLGIEEVHLGVADKIESYQSISKKYGLKKENILYMGDDVPDYEVMCAVGLPACPNDACVEIKSISKYISPYKGGEACVRDVIEQVMRAQGTWFNPLKINDKDFTW